jgi:hypothetical protein
MDVTLQTGLVVLTNTQLSLEDARTSFQPYADFSASVNGTLAIEDSPTWLQFFDKFIGGNVRILVHPPII